jgi:hypothetical protein
MESRSFPVSSRRVRRSLSLVAAASVLAASPPSFAQGRAATAEEPALGADASAKTKFTDALKLYKAGNVADALPLFRDVADATHSPNAELYVGYCLAQSAKRVEAYKAFALVLKQISEHPDEKYEPTREAAEAQLAILNVRLAKIVILIADVTPGLAVMLDGTAVEEKAFGSSIVVEPGTHHVEAAATGLTPVRREVSLEGGELKTLNLSLKKTDEGKPSRELTLAPAAAPRRAAPPPDEKHPIRTAGYVTGAVGVAGVAAFAITGLMAKSTFNKLDRECGAVGCSDSGHQSDIDRGKTLQTIANVGLVVGAVGVVAGGTMILLGGGKQKEPSARVSLSPGGGMVTYGGTF